MKAYTDYPFTELGDVGGKPAPIRSVEVLAYDRNKYCTVLVEGVVSWVKSGYLYKNQARFSDGITVLEEDLCTLPEEYIQDCPNIG